MDSCRNALVGALCTNLGESEPTRISNLDLCELHLANRIGDRTGKKSLLDHALEDGTRCNGVVGDKARQIAALRTLQNRKLVIFNAH